MIERFVEFLRKKLGIKEPKEVGYLGRDLAKHRNK